MSVETDVFHVSVCLLILWLAWWFCCGVKDHNPDLHRGFRKVTRLVNQCRLTSIKRFVWRIYCVSLQSSSGEPSKMTGSSYFPSRKLLLVLCFAILAVSAILYASSSQPVMVFSAQQTRPVVLGVEQTAHAGEKQLTPEHNAQPVPGKQTADVHAGTAGGGNNTNLGISNPGGSPKKNPTASGKTAVTYKDVVDNSKASAILNEYKNLFAANKSDFPGDPNNPDSIKEWWQAAAMIEWYIHSPLRHKCKHRVAAGNWHVCQDAPYTVKSPCLVYSFGINFDFSFDDAMGKMGCEVHSFDPSMGVKDHKRSPQVTFHNKGLGSNDSDTFNARHDIYVEKDQLWKMRTLKTAMKELGHEGRVLDVLKIDIEGHEWAVIENLFETDMFRYVRQFELEFHLFPTWPAKQEYVHLYKLYTRLREMGFREYTIGPHPKTRKYDKFNLQGDSEYVNIYFKPPS